MIVLIFHNVFCIYGNLSTQLIGVVSTESLINKILPNADPCYEDGILYGISYSESVTLQDFVHRVRLEINS
jgi:hypothetical protein